MMLQRTPMTKKKTSPVLGAEKLAKCEKFCDSTSDDYELRESLVSSFWYVVYSALVVPGSRPLLIQEEVEALRGDNYH